LKASTVTERILMSSPDVGELESDYVMAAMRSGWIAPAGPDLTAFEDELAARIGRRRAVALSSGTAALHLALLALGTRRGQVVITSTMTFAATANAIAYTGARPVFIDCDPNTGNMDSDLLREALPQIRREGAEIAAIMPVDLLGKTADYSAILPIAEEFEVPVIADAAESLGARHAGLAAGAFGQAAAFSFNGNKIMTTSGGGVYLTDDEDAADRVRYLSTQARQPVAHYEHTEIGYNYRLSNLLAALGRAQLSRLDEMIARRRSVRARYTEIFADVPGTRIFQAEGDEDDNCWLTSVIVDPEVSGWTAAELSAHLEAANIESRPLWKPMHLQPVFGDDKAFITGASQALFENGLTLPSGSALRDDQVERVIEHIRGFTRR